MKYKRELKVFTVFWAFILFASFLNLTDTFYKKFNFNNSLSQEIQVLSVLKKYNIDNYFDDIHIEDDMLKALVKPSVWQVLTDEQKVEIEDILKKECKNFKENDKQCLKVDILNIK